MMSNDEFEQKLLSYFKENNDIPTNVKNSILEVNLTKNKKKVNKISIQKVIATIVSLIAMSTGIVYAKDISEFAQKIFFDSKKGVETAIENDYIYDEKIENSNNETSNIKIQDVDTRISRIIMDDYTLDIEMMLHIEDNIDLNGVDSIDFPDMLITDDMNNILYCVSNEKIENFYKEKEISKDYKNSKVNYINTVSNVFVKNVNEKYVTVECNLTAIGNQFPRSEKVYIQMDSIEISKNNQNYEIDGDWNIEFTVPEEFVNRQTVIYRVENCNNSNVDVTSISAEVYQTGMKFDMCMYWGDYEEWSEKSNKIRNNNVLDSQLINFEKSYVENEDGEKFYCSKSSYAGNGLTTDGELRMWNTFDLTTYNLTDKLKVVLVTMNNEQIIIELER